MLTRSRLQRGEGEFEEFNPEIGSRKGKMSSPKGEETTSSIPSEGEFLKAFMRMQAMVEELYQDRKKAEQEVPSHVEDKKDPEISDQVCYESLITIACEFMLTTSRLHRGEGELEEFDAEKLDNWIRQIEVYCRIQKFAKDNIKIQLVSLQLGGTALIWWESRSQEDISTKGKIVSS